MKRSLEYIERIVCAVRGLTSLQIREKGANGRLIKSTSTTETRQLIVYFALEAGHTLTSSAGFFGQHHCTAIHSRNHMNDLRQFEKDLSDEIDIIRTVLNDDDMYNEYMRKIVLGKLKRAYIALDSEKIAV